MTTKLILTPTQSGYAIGLQNPLVDNYEDAPASRFTKDIEQNAAIANVAWTLDEWGFQYICSKYKLLKGVTVFPLDMILDGDLEQFDVRFLPGSFSLNSLVNGEYIVSAQVEVKQNAINNALELSRFVAYQAL